MRSALRFHVAASIVLLTAASARAMDRPRYGGTLRIEIGASVSSLDPAAPVFGSAEAQARARLDEMVFDRLITIDAAAHPVPQLATSWSHDADNRKWQFVLRAGVKLDDGSNLTLQDVVDSLRAANRDWQITFSETTLTIETNSPHPDLPDELALERNSIFRRGADGALLGSGPFRVTEWSAGRHATFAANDDYWGGRPFVDAVEIQMGRSARDQVIDLELGRADVVELGIEEFRHAAQENLRTIASSPAVLMAIVFVRGKSAGEDARPRQALALSIDRSTIRDVLLQKQGELAGSLLPGWLSGYAFLFSTQQDVAGAKRLRAQLPAAPTIALGYDAGDLLARAVAERIALNARDVGLTVRAVSVNGEASSSNIDARIVREQLVSVSFREALASMAGWRHEPLAQLRAWSATPAECYEIEQSLLVDVRVIPLFHLPMLMALGPRVRGWTMTPLGDWRPESAWLEPEKP
jgi:peptide/nickel transport system substrate-binding protein